MDIANELYCTSAFDRRGAALGKVFSDDCEKGSLFNARKNRG